MHKDKLSASLKGSFNHVWKTFNLTASGDKEQRRLLRPVQSL